MNLMLSTLLTLKLLVNQSSSNDSIKVKYFTDQNQFFKIELNQVNDSLDFKITNSTADTLRFYLGFFAEFADSTSSRYDYNVFHNTRPLGGKFATRNDKILPGQTLTINKKIAPALYKYMLGFYSYSWFVGSYDRANKQYLAFKLKQK